MIAAMPGRARNSDRQAIEAFARIHQGRAGSANGSGRFNGIHPVPHSAADGGGADHALVENGAYADPAAGRAGAQDWPVGSTAVHSGPIDPTSFGYLPPIPNLERPRMGRRVVVASTATVVVILIALGIAGAASGPGRSHVKTNSKGPAATQAARTSGAAAGSHGRPGSGSATRASGQTTATTSATGSIPPSSTAAGSVRFLMAPGSGPFALTIAAAGGSCWTEVSPSSGSSISWAGTVADGSQRVLAPGSSWWLRLGAPEYATVTVNGRRLQLPTSSTPLDVDIVTS
jgi:hypothetical protein